MLKIGFIGLGIMGYAMAKNLVAAGFDLTVWNRTPERCASLVALGAQQAATPRELAAHCDISFAMLADPDASRAVAEGPDGVAEGIRPGSGYVDFSTVDDETAHAVGKLITARGARYLEAPVSGTKKPAEDGSLIILAAGDRSLYEDAAPLLDRLGKKRLFLGAVGQGARMKLVVNLIMGSMLTALGEGLALGRRSGLDGSAILDVLDAGAMACPMFRGKGPMALSASYMTSFPLKHMQKDLRLALALSEKLGQNLAVTAASNELFKRARIEGFGDEDIAAVFEVIEHRPKTIRS